MWQNRKIFRRFRRHISLNVRRRHKVWPLIFLVRSNEARWYQNQNELTDFCFATKRLVLQDWVAWKYFSWRSDAV